MFKRKQNNHPTRQTEGLPSSDIVNRLNAFFPDEADWTPWDIQERSLLKVLRRFPAHRADGRLGNWFWIRMESPLDENYADEITRPFSSQHWTGIYAFQKGMKRVLLCSLHIEGSRDPVFMVSTENSMWVKELESTFRKGAERIGHLTVNINQGETMRICLEEEGPVFLPDGVLEDIETQTRQFFSQREQFHELGIRYRRGFLFVGASGLGKTLLIRRLIRKIYSMGVTSFWSLRATSGMDNECVHALCRSATQNAPAVLVLDDLDVLMSETQVTPHGFLKALDDLNPLEGILILASTCRIEQLDAALTNSPSRFDKVWRFESPDQNLRRIYLKTLFSSLQQDCLDNLIESTEGWSFSQLKELFTASGLQALEGSESDIQEHHIRSAIEVCKPG